MKTFGDLKEAVKRFVYNNSNAADAFQGNQSGVTFEELLDGAILQAANSARKYVEKNASLSSLEVTVPAFFPKGMGINLDRLYLEDAEFEVSAEVTPASTHLIHYRFDGRGILYIAIPHELDDFWGAGSFETLQSFVVGTSTDEALKNEIPFGEYTVWAQMQDVTLLGKVYHAYRVGYRNSAITRPTAWVTFYDTIGPGYFGGVFRMNTVKALNYRATNGATNPIDLDTRQSEHIRRTVQDRVRRVAVDSESFGGTTCKALLDGRKLELNYLNTEAIPVSISGYRWMDDYTDDSSTDFLLEDAFDFLQWQCIIELNYIVQIYVSRAEGSLPPPEKARNEAWGALLTNDAFAGSSFYQQ